MSGMLLLATLTTGNALVDLLITILVFGVIFWLIDWAIKAIPVPDPFGKIARVILIVAAVIFLVRALLSLT
jgi:hypothetical protein